MSDYGGELALMGLPDDGRLHVQLSRYFYSSTVRRVRDDLEGNRSGLAVVEAAAPINAPVLEIVLDRRSVYLIAFRRQGAREWWGFADDGCPATLPGGPMRPIRGRNTYSWLGLPDSINLTPVQLLSQLASFSGTVDRDAARCLVLLFFLVPEAIRFDSVFLECARYLSAGTQFANTLHPGQHRQTVTNWAAASAADRNVLLRYLP